jgi:hypothetical protein
VTTTATTATEAGRRLAAARAMLTRSGLELRVPPERAALALAHTFNRHRIGSPHAGLVGQAMRPHRDPDHPRPLVEQLIRDLIAHGQPAYSRAVEGALARHLAAEAGKVNRRARNAQRLGPQLDQLGPRAAEILAAHWREGRALTPVQLARALDVHTRDAWPLVAMLAEAGWLELHQCHHPPAQRLKPGPRVREAAS